MATIKIDGRERGQTRGSAPAATETHADRSDSETVSVLPTPTQTYAQYLEKERERKMRPEERLLFLEDDDAKETTMEEIKNVPTSVLEAELRNRRKTEETPTEEQLETLAAEAFGREPRNKTKSETGAEKEPNLEALADEAWGRK